tara:strand:- start:386 stop:1195 length:810 start_codon:yes stop_codon:yes gene_type:complete
MHSIKDFFWRLKEFVKNHFNLYLERKAHHLEKELAQNSNILFTQVKSGTTYFQNFFAAVNYFKFNFTGDFDLLCPEKYGAFRISRSNYKNIKKIVTSSNKKYNNSMPYLIITHHRERLPEKFSDKTKIVMTTRNKLDWVDSALDFKFIRRKKTISRKTAINLLLKRYKETNLHQKNIKKEHDKAVIVNYENLFNDEEIIKIFQFLKIEINLELVNKVKKIISKEKIKEVEKKKGSALVGSKKLDSFFNDKKNKSDLTESEIKIILDYKD